MYSIENAIKGLNFLATFKTKAEFPKGFTPKAEQYVDTVCKSFPYWSQDNKEEFKALVKVIDKTHPALFERLRNGLKALVGVTTLKDVAKTTKNPEILAELMKLSEGMKALKEELAKLFAEKAKEIETPKPKAKAKAKAVVVAGEEELFPL
jgi:vancomycin resistance protein YoaR